MPESDPTTERQAEQQETPGGRSSRGPEYGTGSEPVTDRPVPPYDELRGPNSGEGAEGARKAFDAANAGPPGPGAPVTPEERSGTSATDMEPQPQHGVGERRMFSGEEQAPDRDDVGTKGPADRPVGRAAEEDADSVGTSGSVTSGSPDLQTGDQGG
jgi:hypothetical protein